MNEAILKALMQLFAIVANVDKEGISTKAMRIVESYLKMKLSQRLVDKYLELFTNYVTAFHLENGKRKSEVGKKRNSLNSVKVLRICKQVNKSLQQKEKYIVLVRLIEFVDEDNVITEEELDFINVVAEVFKINEIEYKNTMSFLLHKEEESPEKDNVMVINSLEAAQQSDYLEMGEWFKRNRPVSINEFKHIYRENLNGEIHVLHLSSINTFIFRYHGKDNLMLNGNHIHAGRIYILGNGSILRGRKIQPIYYSDIAGNFLYERTASKITFVAKDVEFRFPKSENGIREFSFSAEGGQLIGVMGGSGTGKSTFLDILNGRRKAQKGIVTINGYDIHEHKDKLKGVIGFVPQDDLLVEELTVFENLYFNAKLSFSSFSETQIVKSVVRVLKDLDLYEIRNLQVGSPLKKVISGGQRKRLNIALELLREPSVLFVDEPTSGLSSMDSEMVMLLLKQLTLKGKMVMVNIHQPSSNIFKLFDKLIVIDKGGHIIYQGNPIDALVYFKSTSHYVDAYESECNACGTVNAEEVLEVVEEKIVNEFGKFTRTRKTTAKEWYEIYKKKIEDKFRPHIKIKQTTIPRNLFNVPSLFVQFKIYLIRNVLAKLTNKQFIIINFLEAPLLALILAYFTKYLGGKGGEYVFSQNENLFAFMFMAVVVALFVGMTVSAEEIIRDRKIRKRESFLNLSWFSYINSKVLLMFVISAIQMITFVIIGNYILEIQGMTLYYWLILFSTACFANLAGLNISAALNSVISIYILIPFMLVPQLLLGGVLVDFDKLHESISRKDVVPVTGDIMVSRWAFEAIAVTQFKKNKYDKHFFEYEQKINTAIYNYSYLIPELKTRVNTVFDAPKDSLNTENYKQNIAIIKHSMDKLGDNKVGDFDYLKDIKTNLNSELKDSVLNYLDKQSKYQLQLKEYYNDLKEEKYKQLVEIYGREKLHELKKDNHNKRVEEFLTNKNSFEIITQYNNKLVRKFMPVYKHPDNKFGRAHFYAPKKQIHGVWFDTLWFNLSIIWIYSFVLYIFLLNNWLRKLMNFFSRYGQR